MGDIGQRFSFIPDGIQRTPFPPRFLFECFRKKDLTCSQPQNIASILYAPATAFLKVSILLLFLQVFVPRRGSVVWWLNISLIVTNCLTYFALMIVMIFECVPRAKITQPYLDGRCINGYDVYLTNASFNSVSDFFILIYPLWAIWKLQMPNNRKLASSVAFLTGVLYVIFRHNGKG